MLTYLETVVFTSGIHGLLSPLQGNLRPDWLRLRPLERSWPWPPSRPTNLLVIFFSLDRSPLLDQSCMHGHMGWSCFLIVQLGSLIIMQSGRVTRRSRDRLRWCAAIMYIYRIVYIIPGIACINTTGPCSLPYFFNICVNINWIIIMDNHLILPLILSVYPVGSLS